MFIFIYLKYLIPIFSLRPLHSHILCFLIKIVRASTVTTDNTYPSSIGKKVLSASLDFNTNMLNDTVIIIRVPQGYKIIYRVVLHSAICCRFVFRTRLNLCDSQIIALGPNSQNQQRNARNSAMLLLVLSLAI